MSKYVIDIKEIFDFIDVLAVALVDHNHIWTASERADYEKMMRWRKDFEESLPVEDKK